MKISHALAYIIKKNNNSLHMSQFGKWIDYLVKNEYAEIDQKLNIKLTNKGLAFLESANL